jgi:hypothetical protein
MSLTTPVVFLIFNRPDLTARTFESIRNARPAQLHVVADGPRPDRPGEANLCEATRAVIEQVDWPCEVTKDYSEINLGCGKRVSSGITGAFKLFEEAIILEDDCLPHPCFFAFCSDLLARYRSDQRVMAITGNNFQSGQRRGPYSYYFSKYPHIWGWATWRRAWLHYDFTMTDWAEYCERDYLRTTCPNPIESSSWTNYAKNIISGRLDTWDFQWMFACWRQSGLAITPQVNLVSNVGFRADATHTVGNSPEANIPTRDIGPVGHPPFVVVDSVADQFVFDTCFGGAAIRAQQSFRARLLRLVRLPVRAARRAIRSISSQRTPQCSK